VVIVWHLALLANLQQTVRSNEQMMQSMKGATSKSSPSQRCMHY
jgi:hypothetical protein